MSDQSRQRALEASPEHGQAQPSTGWQVQLRRELAGLSYDEQVERVRPPAPGGDSTHARAVQRSSAPGAVVQMAPVRSHTDLPDISEAEMGPYMYVPEARKFILTGQGLGTLNAAALWEACLETTDYKPEAPRTDGITPGDKTARVTACRKRLLGGASDAAFKKIIDHDDGNSPRPFVSVVAEAGYNGHAHCHDRHVFGAGTMAGVLQLALRAGWRVPWAPGDDGIASAWTTLSAANAVVADAYDTALVADWENMRVKVARGSGLDAATGVALAGSLMALQKADGPVGSAYADDAKPVYRGGTGYRPMYPGEPEWDTAKSAESKDPNPYTETHKANPLTKDAAGSLTGAVVVFKADENAPGGWYVLTAYPAT
jgi:hypothetical protein